MRYGICLANIGTYSDPRVPVGLALAAEAQAGTACSSGTTSRSSGGRRRPIPGPCWPRSRRRRRACGSARRSRPWRAVAPRSSRTGRDAGQPERRPCHLRRRARRLGVGVRQVRRADRREGASRDARRRARPAARFWSGEEVTHHGEHYTVDGVTLAPTPVQERVPIWIGGNRPASLRRAARLDGWLADSADPTGMTLSPDDVARSIATIGRSDDYDVALLGERGRGDPRLTRGPVRRGGSRTCTTGAAVSRGARARGARPGRQRRSYAGSVRNSTKSRQRDLFEDFLRRWPASTPRTSSRTRSASKRPVSYPAPDLRARDLGGRGVLHQVVDRRRADAAEPGLEVVDADATRWCASRPR